MSDLKILNNRFDYVERQTVELEQALAEMKQQRDAARREATYFRTECRALAGRGNAGHTIEEKLAARLDGHKRDLIPGDRIHAAAVIELEAVLDTIHKITGSQQ